MAKNNGAQRSEAYEFYLPVTKPYRELTDDRRGKIQKLVRAMSQHPNKHFDMIKCQVWGCIATTLTVHPNDENEKRQFTIGKSMEGFVCVSENDNPLDMLPVKEDPKEVQKWAEILEGLCAYIDHQLTQLIDLPECF